MTDSSALPDVRDGLTPLHRVALRAVAAAGPTLTRSSRVVANGVSRKPHYERGELYSAILAQAAAWRVRYPLVEGSGELGDAEGARPAASPHTEVRTSAVAASFLSELDDPAPEGIVALDRRAVSIIVPGPLPHLLVNGAESGDARFPSHNLGEVAAAIAARIDDPSLDLDGLMRHLPGPDLPGGETIHDGGGTLRELYATGRATLRTEDEGGAFATLELNLTGALDGEIRTFTLVELIDAYVEHRREVLLRRDGQERLAAQVDGGEALGVPLTPEGATARVRAQVLRVAERFGDERRSTIVTG